MLQINNYHYCPFQNILLLLLTIYLPMNYLLSPVSGFCSVFLILVFRYTTLMCAIMNFRSTMVTNWNLLLQFLLNDNVDTVSALVSAHLFSYLYFPPAWLLIFHSYNYLPISLMIPPFTFTTN